MKKNTMKFILPIAICICILMGIVAGRRNSTKVNQEYYNGLPLTTSRATFMYDTSTPEKAIGVSDYVFVAKINKILRTEYRDEIEIETGLFQKQKISTPYTIYSINVIENIKGNLKTTEAIEYMQYGGLNEDQKGYTFMSGGSLLNDGEYYILMVNTWGGEGGTIEVAEPSRIISLGSDYNPNLKANIDIIDKYKTAYENEIIPIDENGEKIEIERNISKYDVNYIEEKE